MVTVLDSKVFMHSNPVHIGEDTLEDMRKFL